VAHWKETTSSDTILLATIFLRVAHNSVSFPGVFQVQGIPEYSGSFPSLWPPSFTLSVGYDRSIQQRINRLILLFPAKSHTHTKLVSFKAITNNNKHQNNLAKDGIVPTPSLYLPNGSIGIIVRLQFATSCFGNRFFNPQISPSPGSHIIRMPPGRPANHAMSWTPRGSGRRQGRPTNNWRSAFKEDLVDRGVDWNSGRAVATNRSRWRTLAAHCLVKDWRI